MQCLIPGAWLNDEVSHFCNTHVIVVLSVFILNRFDMNDALFNHAVTALVQVINVYMQLLKERENRRPEKFLKCHFFNTFFYNKVLSALTEHRDSIFTLRCYIYFQILPHTSTSFALLTGTYYCGCYTAF